MMELGESPMKLSHLSRKLDFTVQETSRNMARLIRGISCLYGVY
jgi:tetrahydromethanopterin S-methyltransferase subunit G